MGSCARAACSAAVAMTTVLAVGAPPAVAAPGWGPVVDLTGPGPATYTSDVAVSARGRVVAVWQRGTGRRAHLFMARRRHGGGWTDPARVPGTRGVTDAVAHFDGSGALVVAWASGRHVLAAQRPTGRGWDTPVSLATTPSGSANGTFPGYLALDVNARGRAVVAWQTVDDDADGVYARTRVQAVVAGSGSDWGRVHTLSTRYDAFRPQVGLDDRGRATVVWSEQTGRTGSRVMVASRSVGSPWAAARSLSRRHTDTGIPSLAVAGSGRLAVAWSYGTSGLDGLKLRRWSPAGGWQRAVRAPAVAQSPAWLAIGIDAAGTVSVVLTPRLRGAVRALDEHPGGRWSAARTLSPAGSFFSDLALEVNADGSAVAGWVSVDHGNHPVLGAYRPSSGPWSRATLLSDPQGDGFGPELGLTPAGGAVAVWAHLRSATTSDRGRIQARSLRAP